MYSSTRLNTNLNIRSNIHPKSCVKPNKFKQNPVIVCPNKCQDSFLRNSQKYLCSAISDAIFCKNNKINNRLLKKGINNDDCENNTINFTIKNIFQFSQRPIDIERNSIKPLIKTLIFNGAVINNKKNNTLSLALNGAIQYILESSDHLALAENNMLKFIQFLIDGGAKPSDHHANNTLTIAIRSQNLNIIKIIAQTNPKPDNDCFCCSNYGICFCLDGQIEYLDTYFNTLTNAVRTNNIEIVKIACKLDAHPCNKYSEKNTLTQAILIGNLDILKCILTKGAKPVLENIHSSPSTFRVFYDRYIGEIYPKIDQCTKNDTIDQMIDLIMCSGATIPQSLIDEISEKKGKNYYDEKIIQCHAILQDRSVSSYKNCIPPDKFFAPKEIDRPTDEIQKLKEKLKYTMDQLISIDTVDRQNKIMVVTYIPLCLINIIYEYQYTEPLIRYIDWIKK